VDKNKKYLALDLELNNAEDNSTAKPKIIQVGVAIGSFLDFQNDNLLSQKWYLNPEEPIFEFITRLTGITNADIKKNAVAHAQVALEIGALIKSHECFINPVVWGGGDSAELKSEFRDRSIAFPHFGRRWIDVKTWFLLTALANGKNPNGGLSSALTACKLSFKGAPHRADDDALNTLRLFFELLYRQYKIHQLLVSAKQIS
jgi:inhibitor of KinA sporulation pathway (predicted exonuclease)